MAKKKSIFTPKRQITKQFLEYVEQPRNRNKNPEDFLGEFPDLKHALEVIKDVYGSSPIPELLQILDELPGEVLLNLLSLSGHSLIQIIKEDIPN